MVRNFEKSLCLGSGIPFLFLSFLISLPWTKCYHPDSAIQRPSSLLQNVQSMYFWCFFPRWICLLTLSFPPEKPLCEFCVRLGMENSPERRHCHNFVMGQQIRLNLKSLCLSNGENCFHSL